jgi:hypothetical protein
MSDNQQAQAASVALKNELTITYNNQEYVFKIPSIGDRILISGRAAKLRKESDPDGTGISLGYDPSAVMLTEKIATFMVLLKSTSSPWVYFPDEHGKPGMDVTKWPDDVPIMEVVDEFNDELAKFRGARVQS